MKKQDLLSIADFAKKRGVSKFTVYSWISRGQAEKNGFKVVKVGNFNLITLWNQKI